MVIILILVAGLGIIIASVVLLRTTKKQSTQFGALSKEQVYHDTKASPGRVLYAKTLELSGKPDYLIKDEGVIIPVEVKTGKTPSSPYVNHTTQLMAYCLLIEENYGVRPTGGYLKYPEKEFKIAYTKEAENSVRKLVEEIQKAKREGEEQKCNHPEHNS